MKESDEESNPHDYSIDKKVTYKTGERFTIFALIINIILASTKVLAGIFGNSHAVLADGIHSAADSFSTGLVHAAVVIAQKPKDDKYNFGYGKIESIVSAFIGIALVVIGSYLIFSSIAHIVRGELSEPSMIALFMALVSIVAKEFLFKYGMKLGRKLNSDAIVSMCWDFRSDVYSSIGAFFGVLGAMVGRYYDIYMLKIFDSVAGAIVGLVILYVSVIVMKKAYNGLMDVAPDQEILNVISEVLESHKYAVKKNFVRARYSGSRIHILICLKVKSHLSIKEAYEIEKKIENEIKDLLEYESAITIDLEPNEISD